MTGKYPVVPSNTTAYRKACPNCNSNNIECIGKWLGLYPAIFICKVCQHGFILRDRHE